MFALASARSDNRLQWLKGTGTAAIAVAAAIPVPLAQYAIEGSSPLAVDVERGAQRDPTS